MTKLKVLILTIIVGFLGVLSLYFVLQDFKYRQNLSLSPVSSRYQNDKEYSVFLKESGRGQAAFILPVVESNYLPLRDWNILEPDISAKAAVIFDTQSEKFLLQKNLKTLLPVASITKLLTAAVVLDNISLDSKIFITQEAMNIDNEGGEDFYLDEAFFARDLLKAMLIKSSNDAAAAFQIFFNGNNLDIVGLINKKAQDIGMLNSKFYDPAGLNDQGYSTAEDLIKLTDYITRYPEIQNILLAKNARITSVDGRFNHQFESTNKLLGVIPDIQASKTGFTDAALGTMVLKVGLPQYESSLIGVILGSDDRLGDMQKLIAWAKEAHKWR